MAPSVWPCAVRNLAKFAKIKFSIRKFRETKFCGIEKSNFGAKSFFRVRTRQSFYAPLLGEFWRSSQDSFVLVYGTEESRDVRQNSAKSGVSNFGKMVLIRPVWEQGNVLIGTQEMS